ncbi:MAG: HEPN domain-containing protein [Bacteroidaceae bacterium]|nr:HEPN domain-containing protein [Bacteroidaceae bacterium]
MTREEKVQYWLDIAAEDLDLGEFLFHSGRWLYSAFMCHQVIEKMFKAYWTATRDDVPPYIHEHKRLAELCGLYGQMSDEQRDFLQEIRPMNIEARYPDYKRSIANTLNEEKTHLIVEQTKQMQQWILQKCSPETKPSTSSANTNK